MRQRSEANDDRMPVAGTVMAEVPAGPVFPRCWLLAGVALSILSILAVEQFELAPSFPLTRALMQGQDMPVLIGVAGLLLALARLVPDIGSRGTEKISAAPWASLAVLIFMAFAVVALGTEAIAFDYALTRDEVMARFDAAILASGQLIANVQPDWRPFVPALQPEFRLSVPGNAAWISTYLPGNAGIRALLGLILAPVIVNALLVLTALVALLGIAQTIWPKRPDAWIIAVGLAATSSQVLCMSMTSYAMSTHLALNLVWLWLFLRDRTLSHIGAVAVGFVATGLHQIIFHPLFVAPFLLQLLLDRRWNLALVYAASYGAIGLFWIHYWQWVLALNGVPAEAASGMGLQFLFSRIASMLADFSFSRGLETMAQNLLRFAAWQNPLMLVLLAPGMVLAWRDGGVFRALAGGIVLTVVAMFVLLPYQDIGWGYRYVHGLIGSAALLSALGWVGIMTAATPLERRDWWGVAGITTAAATLVLFPIHALQMRARIAPFAHASAAIDKATSEAVVVETIGIYYGIDLVRNDPFLRNRPLVFDIGLLDMQLARELCARMSVTIFDGNDAGRVGMALEEPSRHSDVARIRALRSYLESQECRRKPTSE